MKEVDFCVSGGSSATAGTALLERLGRMMALGALAGVLTFGVNASGESEASPMAAYPDFIVQSIILNPVVAVAGETVTASITVKNNSTVAGVAGWLDYWGHRNDKPAVGAGGSTGHERLGTLAGGATATVTVTFVAEKPGGAKKFWALIDSGGETVEESESNNAASVNYTVIERADFAIVPLEISLNTVEVGQNVTVYITVGNSGTKSANAGLLSWWYDRTDEPQDNSGSDGVIQVGDISVGSFRSYEVTFAAQGPPGTKTFWALIDSTNVTEERNENNNAAAISYTVTSKPDFIVESVTLSSTTVAPGETISFLMVVKNNGSGLGDAGWIDWWADRATPPVNISGSVGRQRLANIAAHRSKFVFGAFQAPLTPGVKKFWTLVDSTKMTPETDESNNTKSAEYTVVSVGAPVIVTGGQLPDGQELAAYRLPLAVQGGKPPYAWSLVSGGLPTGLGLGSSGIIEGTPEVPGAYSFTVRVTDDNGQSATKIFSITVTSKNNATPPDMECHEEGDDGIRLAAAGMFNGFLFSTDTEHNFIEGMMSLKVARLTGALTAKVTARGGAISFKGKTWSEQLENGVCYSRLEARGGEKLDLFVAQNIIWGSMSGGRFGTKLLKLEGQRNRFAERQDAAAQALLAQCRKYFTVTLGDGRPVGFTPNDYLPTGYGYLTMSVRAAGMVSIAGVLADGSKVAAATQLQGCENSVRVPFFAPLYRKQGHVSGMMEFDAGWNVANPNLVYKEGEPLHWVRPGTGPDGFDLLLMVRGGVYQPGLPYGHGYGLDIQIDPGLARYFHAGGVAEVSNLRGIIRVLINGGRMGLPRPLRPVLVSGEGEARYEYDPDNPVAATISANARNGIFRGKCKMFFDFADSAGRLQHKAVSVSYSGVMLADPVEGVIAGGFGHALYPANDPELQRYRMMLSCPAIMWGL